MTTTILTSKYESLASNLRAMIEDDYVPRQVLPSETCLAKKFGTSTGTVRRAMRILVQEGLLVRGRGKGTVVADNPSGDAARTRRVSVKSVAILSFGEEPFFRLEIDLMQKELFRLGYTTSLCNISELGTPEASAEIEEMLRTHEMDGLICGPVYRKYEQVSRFFEDAKFPVVFMNATEPIPANYVSVDMSAGGYAAASHLYQIGCRRIRFFGLLGSGDPAPWYITRGLERFVEEFYPDKSLADIQVPAMGSVDSGYKVASDEFSAGRVPDGIIAKNDLCAIGIEMAAKEHGVRIPQDMALVGFDDINRATETTPALTTVSHSNRQYALEAVRILEECLSEGNTGMRHCVLLQPTLLVRQSTIGFVSKATIACSEQATQEGG